MSGKNHVWNNRENIATLKRMWVAGALASDIAERLGVTENTIRGKVHRLGLEPRNESAHRKRNISSRAKPAKPKAALPRTRWASLLDHSDKACRWPLDDCAYCTEPRVSGFSYCTGHLARAVVKRKTA